MATLSLSIARLFSMAFIRSYPNGPENRTSVAHAVLRHFLPSLTNLSREDTVALSISASDEGRLV